MHRVGRSQSHVCETPDANIWLKSMAAHCKLPASQPCDVVWHVRPARPPRPAPALRCADLPEFKDNLSKGGATRWILRPAAGHQLQVGRQPSKGRPRQLGGVRDDQPPATHNILGDLHADMLGIDLF
jgi:hypothetical protein